MSTDPKEEITIRGTLYKPSGDGPYPAVVVLHGCAGVIENHFIWASRLKKWGYVAMVVDSHGPRRIYNNCRQLRFTTTERAVDAENAKNYLANMPFVDRNNIGVLGFSEGGGVVLALASYQFPSLVENASPFRAAVAFYPPCRVSLEVKTNLMILVGEKDDWTPGVNCVNYLPYSTKDNYEVILKVYPNAYHCFDNNRNDIIYLGHVLKYNHKAASDAIIRTKTFFDKHLKN